MEAWERGYPETEVDNNKHLNWLGYLYMYLGQIDMDRYDQYEERELDNRCIITTHGCSQTMLRTLHEYVNDGFFKTSLSRSPHRRGTCSTYWTG